MPDAMQRFCLQPGCQTLVRSGRCDEHQRERGRGASAEWHHWYADRRWRAARAIFLKQHPLCAECQDEGRIEAATVVDHVIPHKGDRRLFWDRTNWAACCKTHHDRKTATQDGGFGARRGAGGGL